MAQWRVTPTGERQWRGADGVWRWERGPAPAPPTVQRPTSIGRDRSPAFVLGISILSFGVYFLYWYGQVNEEIRRHDGDIKVSPGWSVLALFVPFANIISAYSTAARIRQMQLDDGATDTISPVVALLLLLFLGIGYPLYVSSQVREHWHRHRLDARAPGLPVPREIGPSPVPVVAAIAGMCILLALGVVAAAVAMAKGRTVGSTFPTGAAVARGSTSTMTIPVSTVNADAVRGCGQVVGMGEAVNGALATFAVWRASSDAAAVWALARLTTDPTTAALANDATKAASASYDYLHATNTAAEDLALQTTINDVAALTSACKALGLST